MASEKDLIRRGDVLELLYRIKQDKSWPKNYGTLLTIINETWEMPTVDAVEVVHGEWLQMEFWPNGGTWRCSECGRQIMFLEGTPITEEMHYCPQCGAKMDGGDKE